MSYRSSPATCAIMAQMMEKGPMPRRQLYYSTVKDATADSVWKRYEFPTVDITNLNGWNRSCDGWFAARHKLSRPFCFTPTKRFSFGGKEYIPLYPCIAFATKNFGFIFQRKWNELVGGRE